MKETTRQEGLMEKLFRLEMLLHRRQIRNLRAYGPFGNPLRGQGRVLTILKMQPTISQKQLSYLLDMRQQSLSELLFKLEKSGLIERTPSEDDKRAVIITLTDKGREAADGADATAPDGIFDCLSDEEQAQLSALLDKLLEALGDRADARDDFRRPFGPHAHPFAHGPFGPHGFFGGFGPGPFGPEAPFGPEGPFGPWDRCGHDHGGRGEGFERGRREEGGERRHEHHGEDGECCGGHRHEHHGEDGECCGGHRHEHHGEDGECCGEHRHEHYGDGHRGEGRGGRCRHGQGGEGGEGEPDQE